MYRFVKTNNEELGYSEQVNWMEYNPNLDLGVPCEEADADCVSFNNILYNLLGHSSIDYAETVQVIFVDNGEFIKLIHQNEQDINDLCVENAELMYDVSIIQLGL